MESNVCFHIETGNTHLIRILLKRLGFLPKLVWQLPIGTAQCSVYEWYWFTSATVSSFGGSATCQQNPIIISALTIYFSFKDFFFVISRHLILNVGRDARSYKSSTVTQDQNPHVHLYLTDAIPNPSLSNVEEVA